MKNQEIVAKLWKLCDVLRDDGITYHQYVTELTYILFLKMAKETGTEDGIPEQYRWDVLRQKSGIELKRILPRPAPIPWRRSARAHPRNLRRSIHQH